MLINQVSVAYPGCKRHGSFDLRVGGALGKRFVYVCLPTSAKGSRRMALNGRSCAREDKTMSFGGLVSRSLDQLRRLLGIKTLGVSSGGWKISITLLQGWQHLSLNVC